MAYAYQQNVFEGASYGYVKYDITPDLGTPIAAGETIRITGQAYLRNRATRSISVGITSGNKGKYAVVNVAIPKATVRTFTLEFRMWDVSDWNSARLFPLPISFTFWTGQNYSGDGWGTMEVSAQAISYLAYRIRPVVRSATFERSSLVNGAYASDDEGTSVLGTLSLELAPGYGVADITIASVALTGDGVAPVTIALSSPVLTAALGSAGYSESVPAIFEDITFLPGSNYTLVFCFGDAYDTAASTVYISRSFANMHLSGASTGGVAFGKFSAAQEGSPLFECAYPAEFSGGIRGVTIYDTAETDTGGKWLDGKPIYRSIFTFGAYPAGTRRSIGVITNLDTIIRLWGFARVGAQQQPIPNMPTSFPWVIGIYVSEASEVLLETGSSRTATGGFVIAEYTKTTDQELIS